MSQKYSTQETGAQRHGYQSHPAQSSLAQPDDRVSYQHKILYPPLNPKPHHESLQPPHPKPCLHPRKSTGAPAARYLGPNPAVQTFSDLKLKVLGFRASNSSCRVKGLRAQRLKDLGLKSLAALALDVEAAIQLQQDSTLNSTGPPEN